MASIKDNIPSIKSDVVKALHAKNPLRTTEAVGVGLFNERLVQDSPSFAKSEEEVIKANGNAWIVLGGSDRPGNFQTGYGAKGHHGANKIDIVIGRESSATGGANSDSVVHPNFFTDAARIYMSQKTDIDKNFAIDSDTELSIFEGNIGRSGIGIKADAVRLVGRESIKIVTGKGKNIQSNGSRGELNSQGGEIDHVGTIDLIAGNNIENGRLQPMALGKNLNMAVQELTEIVEDLQSSVHNLAKYQNRINRALITHTHIATAPGAPVTPSPDLAPQAGLNAGRIFASVTAPIIAIKYNLMFYRLKYLKKHSSNWICSSSCRLTD